MSTGRTTYIPAKTNLYCNNYKTRQHCSTTQPSDTKFTARRLNLQSNSNNGTAFGYRGFGGIGHHWNNSAKPVDRSRAKQRHLWTPKEDRQGAMGHCGAS